MAQENQTTGNEGVNERKLYSKPQLQDLGDLRGLTLGGSPRILEAGSGGSTLGSIYTGT